MVPSASCLRCSVDCSSGRFPFTSPEQRFAQCRTSLNAPGITAVITACFDHWRFGLGFGFCAMTSWLESLYFACLSCATVAGFLRSLKNAVSCNAALASSASSTAWRATLQLLQAGNGSLAYPSVLPTICRVFGTGHATSVVDC